MQPFAETPLTVPAELAWLMLRRAPVGDVLPAGSRVSRYRASAPGAFVRLVELLPVLARLRLYYICIASVDIQRILHLRGART